jgi:hypothetical protein
VDFDAISERPLSAKAIKSVCFLAASKAAFESSKVEGGGKLTQTHLTRALEEELSREQKYKRCGSMFM